MRKPLQERWLLRTEVCLPVDEILFSSLKALSVYLDIEMSRNGFDFCSQGVSDRTTDDAFVVSKEGEELVFKTLEMVCRLLRTIQDATSTDIFAAEAGRSKHDVEKSFEYRLAE